MHCFGNVARIGYIIWTGRVARIGKAEINTTLFYIRINIDKIGLYEYKVDKEV
jgi:hypothetical protein